MVRIRRAIPEDADVCGNICYQAFSAINRQHNFPPEIPSADAAQGRLRTLFSHPEYFCVVAESEGKIVGSNCLDERCAVVGVGPVSVDPSVQNRGVGRMLMQAVMDRASERGFPGMRLMQSAFHNRSLSLYTKLGFDAREPMSVMHGPPMNKSLAGCAVRAAKDDDLEACNRVCERVHGHNRAGELRDAIEKGTAVVVERHGRNTGYASALGYYGHVVGESDLDVQALIARASTFAGPGIIVPTRNAALFRWCLENGLRVVHPLTLMTTGLYDEPVGAYLPSILY